MSYYFVGGEDHDFSRIGFVSVNTATTAARRTANARCSLQVGTGAGNAATDGWQAALTTTATSFWFTARLYFASLSSQLTTQDLLPFLDGTTRRLILCSDASSHFRLSKQNAAGTRTVLATSSLAFTTSVLYKIDVQIISYGAAATVNVYVDSVLWITYTGDITTDSSTSLSGFALGNCALNGSHYWSEIICTSDDTRGLSLVTLPPAANGNAFAWSNTYASLDEVTLDDADLSTSAAANDILETTVTSSGITGTPAIRAVCVSARAQKGGTGPQNIQAMVRTGGNDYVSGTIALPPAFNRVANIWETNPATSGAWAYTDLTAAGFNIGVKSIT